MSQECFSKIAIIMSFCPEQFFREHRYCFFATSFLKYSPCRSTPLQLYWESQSSYGWFYATNPSPHDRITAFFHRLQRKLVAPRGKCHDKKRSTDSPYRKKRDRKIDVAPRHSRSEPVLFRKNHSRRARHRLHENRRYGKNAGCRHDRAHAHRQPAVQGCRSHRPCSLYQLDR